MALEVEGVVHSILSPVEGVSARGAAWKKQEVVIETLDGEFSRKVCITFFGEKAEDAARLAPGEKVKVSINLESREYNGKWFTNVNAWKVERSSASPAELVAPVSDYDGFAPENSLGDDLPF